MLRKVTITNYLGKSQTYVIDDVQIVDGEEIHVNPTIDDESGLFITSIEGLCPVKADINMTSLATADGEIFNSKRLNGRNIVIKAKFTYAKTIEEARLMSYKYFPIGHKVTFVVQTENRLAKTEGYVESNEAVIFSDDCETQISILCESPYFLAIDEDGNNITNFSSVVPLFEFPFSNESTTDPLIEFGTIVQKRESIVYYDGDVETGCIMTIHAIGDAENLVIHKVNTNEKMTIDTDKLETMTGHKIIFGDTIEISTIKGQKYIHLIRDGVTTNILNTLAKDSDWFQLDKGDNVFAYDADGAEYLQFSIESQVTFEGV